MKNSLAADEELFGSQRVLHRHSGSLLLPVTVFRCQLLSLASAAKGLFIGIQRVFLCPPKVHSLATKQSFIGNCRREPPRCSTRVTFLGHARQLITQKKCHPGEHLFDSFRCLWPEQPCQCAEMCSHAHVRATNIFCPELHQHSLLMQMRVKSAVGGALD